MFLDHVVGKRKKTYKDVPMKTPSRTKGRGSKCIHSDSRSLQRKLPWLSVIRKLTGLSCSKFYATVAVASNKSSHQDVAPITTQVMLIMTNFCHQESGPICTCTPAPQKSSDGPLRYRVHGRKRRTFCASMLRVNR